MALCEVSPATLGSGQPGRWFGTAGLLRGGLRRGRWFLGRDRLRQRTQFQVVSKKSNTRKGCTAEFKRDAVALVHSSGKTVTEVAREIGVSPARPPGRAHAR